MHPHFLFEQRLNQFQGSNPSAGDDRGLPFACQFEDLVGIFQAVQFKDPFQVSPGYVQPGGS